MSCVFLKRVQIRHTFMMWLHLNQLLDPSCSRLVIQSYNFLTMLEIDMFQIFRYLKATQSRKLLATRKCTSVLLYSAMMGLSSPPSTGDRSDTLVRENLIDRFRMRPGSGQADYKVKIGCMVTKKKCLGYGKNAAHQLSTHLVNQMEISIVFLFVTDRTMNQSPPSPFARMAHLAIG